MRTNCAVIKEGDGLSCVPFFYALIKFRFAAEQCFVKATCEEATDPGGEGDELTTIQ